MQPLEIVVRQAIEADFQKIIASYNRNGSNPFNLFSSVDRLRQLPSLGLIVAEVNKVYAGFLYWFLIDEQNKDGVSEKNAHIVVVKVEKKFPNIKVGLLLLQKALKDIDEEKVNAICVDTLEANIQLRDLYEKLGFSTVDRTLHMRARARIQASLASCSIISKLLWKGVSDEKRLMLSREMRQILELPEENPLPVQVRNAFEHMDERIIDWLPKQGESIPWGWSISSFQEEEEPRDSSQALRYFQVDTLEFRVADSSCNLKEVMKQVQNIVKRIPTEAQIYFEKL